MSITSIRRGTWETNSSSTHAICINYKEAKLFPETLHFGFGEFGWQWDILTTPEEKAAYLWTAICDCAGFDYIKMDIQECKTKIIETLAKVGVKATFEEPNFEEFYMQGYVDHAGELFDWIVEVLRYNLIEFLFNDESKIYMGNDNDDNEMWEKEVEKLEEKDDYRIYYKLN